MTGDLLYFAAFGLLAALIVVPALLLMRRASPRRGGRVRGPAAWRARDSRLSFFLY